MIYLKKTTLAALVLSSTTAIAGSMGPVCTENNVTTPCVNQGWGFGVEALYLKPTYSSAFTVAGYHTTADSTTKSIVENNPKWQWGFKLEADYLFNSGNDLNLNWSYLVSKTNVASPNRGLSFINADHEDMNGPSHFLSKPSWNAINLEFGQRVNFKEQKNIRFHGGVQFAQIKLNASLNGLTQISNITTQFQASLENQYNGFGPRIGADLTYGLMENINIYANGATALLTGQAKTTSTYTDNINGPDNVSGSNTSIVPELEAKLGLSYSKMLGTGMTSLTAGYQWINYFNTLTILYLDSNFAIQGPFLGLKWVGHA